MGCGGDAGYRAVKDHVVFDQGIRYDLDAFTGVPYDIALYDVQFGATAIDKDAGVPFVDIGVVNDVVTDGIAVGADLDFDAVIAALAGAAQVVDVVAFEQAVRRAIGTRVTADIHALAFGGAGLAQARVMNVVVADNKGMAVTAVHGEGIVAGVKDLAGLQGDVVSADKTDTRTATLKTQAPDDQMGTVHEFDVVVFVDVVRGACQQGGLSLSRTYHNGFALRALDADRSSSILRIGTALQGQFIPGLQGIGVSLEVFLRVYGCGIDFKDSTTGNRTLYQAC